MRHESLLFEIGTEELPPKALVRLADALSVAITEGLSAQHITFSAVKVYCAPRRLAVHLSDVAEAQPEQTIERRGPAVQVAYDEDGKPTQAMQGFMRACGIEQHQVETLKTDKGEWLWFKATQPGKPLVELLPNIIASALQRLPVPKMMRWGDANTPFIRPVHWLVLLYGNEVVPFEAYGCQASNVTYGHRYHHPAALVLAHADDYATLLQDKGYVMPDADERCRTIEMQTHKIATDIGGHAVIEPELLAEVANIVEWPCALWCQFDPEFLQVPQEALMMAMQRHQKCFAVLDGAGQMLPRFITVSNIESTNPASVVRGNEKVMRARLADAMFFYRTDCQQRLTDRVPNLTNVTFQHQLGSLADKSERIAKLSVWIAEQIGADTKLAKQAAGLCKADLLTDMVGEFPDLQGVMGQYYARHDGEPEAVAVALREHYMPRFAADEIPATQLGCVVSVADKIDTLVGIFGIGQPPTGSKDPFALRRASIGVLRVLLETEWPLDLAALLQFAVEQYAGVLTEAETAEHVYDFCLERLKGLALDQSLAHDVFDAVEMLPICNPADLFKRMQALMLFKQAESAESLISANKRVVKLLSKAAQTNALIVDATLLAETAEQQLFVAVEALQAQVSELVTARQYEAALAALSTLSGPIAVFFEAVMVMAEDEKVRCNRLALLQLVRQVFIQVADISCLRL